MSVRTRFAPSPSGFLHLGGARTALYNYLFARHHGGTFVLRIEDTDRDRSTPESVAAILDGLEWLGLEWDEGPSHQSERTALYRERLTVLRERGHLYPCYCSPEELDAKRAAARSAGRTIGYDRTCRDREPPAGDPPHVLRFRTPLDGGVRLDDAVKGPITFALSELDDFVVARSDGSPVYNFCATVDDADMQITHVIRGDDHLTNTPRQMLLYDALGAARPRFAHVSMILGSDKQRLSKRHGATSVTAYRDLGYLPHALVNYLARLGWSHGDQELFTREELIAAFSLDAVGRSPAVFDPDKLEWVNFHWLKEAAPADLVPALLPLLAERGLPPPHDLDWLARATRTLQERAKTLAHLADGLGIYFGDTVDMNDGAARKHLKPAVREPIDRLITLLTEVEPWNARALEAAFHTVLDEHGLKLGKLAQPVRVAVTGSTVSPGIFDVLDVLGRERSLTRLSDARARIPAADDAAKT